MKTGAKRKLNKPRRAVPNSQVNSGHRASDRRRRQPVQGKRPLIATAIVALVAIVGAGALAAWFLVRNDEDTPDTNGPRPISSIDSSDIHSLLSDPADPDHVIFGSHAGTQESRDGGFSWNSGTLRNADAMSLATSSRAPDTLYAAGHDVFQVSRDGGQTWETVTHNLPGTDIHGFAQDPIEPRRLFAFVAGMGVYMSADGGTTWEPLPSQPPGGSMQVVLASNGSALYAVAGAGIVATRDLGVAWEPLPSQPNGDVISLAVSESNPQIMYAGTASGLLKSMDGGSSWTALGPDGAPVITLAVAPTDSERVVFVVEGGDVYRSDDGGATWRAPS